MAAMEKTKYLTLARRAREEGNAEDAKRFYDLVRTEDPENVEARFFYAYYCLWSGTKGSAYDDFMKFCNSTRSLVDALAGSDLEEDEKLKMLDDMYASFNGLGASMRKIQLDLWKSAPDSQKAKYNDQKKKCEMMGIAILYNFGDAVEELFADNAKAQQVAVNAWKSGVALQQQYPYCGIEKTLPEKYFPKIQKAEPDYKLPKKAGCISFG